MKIEEYKLLRWRVYRIISLCDDDYYIFKRGIMSRLEERYGISISNYKLTKILKDLRTQDRIELGATVGDAGGYTGTGYCLRKKYPTTR